MNEEVSPAIGALLDLMTNPSLTIGQRIEAARAIIEFEAPPAVFELARSFLMGVAENADFDLKIRALQLVRKVEARRVVPGEGQAKHDVALAERMAAARERLAARAEGRWTTPNVESLAEHVEGNGLAARLQRARLSSLRT
ncbi:MAG: hypothetical protein J0I42_18865 [Bosea sp.]|uniref:hypothetical protein n=1 Tax=Bosea sp. (in: a-proteobacteria) TaxID=1871050 RepID=UPI001AC9EB3C|nr:hypothetical protein [Bosea sp. (in: a-proteobacteria)]MBN9454004.1 hypothetical protein [Bosea sp. (in: a-proteobacteria)]